MQRIAWFVLSTLIQGIAIYLVDSVIQSSNNWGQNYLQLKHLFPCWGIGYDEDDDDDDDDNDYDYLHFP